MDFWSSLDAPRRRSITAVWLAYIHTYILYCTVHCEAEAGVHNDMYEPCVASTGHAMLTAFHDVQQIGLRVAVAEEKRTGTSRKLLYRMRMYSVQQ